MTAILAAFGTEAELRHAVDRLRSADLTELETFSPLPIADETASSSESWLPALVLAGGIGGGGFMFFLETLSTVSSWGYPVDIGGRPAFSWPAYIPIAIAFALLSAAIVGLIGYLIASAAWRLWDPVDAFDDMRRASRDRWIVHVTIDGEQLLDRARLVLTPLRPVAIRVLSHDLEEVPA